MATTRRTVKVITAIVRMSPAQIRDKFGRYLSNFEKDARFRRPRGMPDCTAIQHPDISALGQDGIVDLCNEYRIPLVYTEEVEPFT